jgi:hypothetical protein
MDDDRWFQGAGMLELGRVPPVGWTATENAPEVRV